MPVTYDDIINKTFNQLTVIGLAERRKSGEQLFYCDCSCGTHNHLASKHQLISGNLKSCGCLRKDKENIIGQRFSRLVVIEKTQDKNKSNKVQLFLCKCDCGNTVLTTKSKLQHGSIKSCGCLLKEIITKHENLVGNRYGKLVVIKRIGNIKNKKGIFWECKCDCGNTILRTTGNLTCRKGPQGCGCIKKELIQNYRKSIGKDPDKSVKPYREQLRQKLKKLKLDKFIFFRDNYTCQLCGNHGITLNAHHIIPVSVDESQIFNVFNMITLCKICHKAAHNGNFKRINQNIQIELQNKIALIKGLS